ncbi:MAG: MarR family transcriptional regulator [Dehalococcoidia bacterium]
MRALRAEMRRHRSADLSVPQFRVLAFVDRRRGATLSEVAEHIGLTLPSASRMVDGLVARKRLTRGISPSDRRFVALALTAQGRSRLESARRATKFRLAGMLKGLSVEERLTVFRAMEVLRPVFMPGKGPEADGAG